MANKTSAARKARFSSYESSGTRQKNRDAKLARHVKANPEDAQARKAVGKKVAKKVASKVKGNFKPAKAFVLVDAAGKPKAATPLVKPLTNPPRMV